MLPDLKVFISSTAEDIRVAEGLGRELANYGIESLISGERSGLHTDLEIEVRAAIEESYAFVLIMSGKSLESESIKHELELAVESRSRKIMLLALGGLQDPKFAGFAYTIVQSDSAPELFEHAADLLYQMRPVTWSDSSGPVVNFSSDVSPEQLTGVLGALSRYWRCCGGIGFVVESHGEEMRVWETVNA